MAPDTLKAFFRFGIFVAGASFILLFLVERDTAEFVVTVLSLCIGITLILSVWALIWYANR